MPHVGIDGAGEKSNCGSLFFYECSCGLENSISNKTLLDPISHYNGSMCAKSLQSCLTLCDPVHCSPPASSVHGILQARILEWVAGPSSRASSWSRNRTRVSCILWIAGRVFTAESPGKPSDIHIFLYVPPHRALNLAGEKREGIIL